VRTVERDLTSERVTYRMFSEGGDLDAGSVAHIEAIDLELGHRVERVFRVDENDPLAARSVIHERLLLRRPPWEVTVDARTATSASESEFRSDASLDAYEGGKLVFSRQWNERIARDLL
jgi:uncharacterized protein